MDKSDYFPRPMNIPLTTKEKLEIALGSVDRRIDSGMCFECAIIAVAEYFKLDQEKLETLWIESKVPTD